MISKGRARNSGKQIVEKDDMDSKARYLQYTKIQEITPRGMASLRLSGEITRASDRLQLLHVSLEVIMLGYSYCSHPSHSPQYHSDLFATFRK